MAVGFFLNTYINGLSLLFSSVAWVFFLSLLLQGVPGSGAAGECATAGCEGGRGIAAERGCTAPREGVSCLTAM